MINLTDIEDDVLEIAKAKLGLTSLIDDTTVRFALVAAKQELTDNYGITLDTERADHVNVLTDMAVFNYQMKGDKGALPRHLEFRVNNLMLGKYYE